MRTHESAEMYLETILVLHERKGYVRAIDIANEMGFSKPSVSIAMKNLRASECIEVSPEGNITLTDKGRAIAEKIYERHQYITDWLRTLGVSAETAEDDACRIEHVISDETFEALKQHAVRQQQGE